jgi:tetratricopeptide (TPR) repeat protein
MDDITSDEVVAADELRRVGRYADALSALERARVGRPDRLRADVLRVELLERTGRAIESKALAETLAKTGQLSQSQLSVCAFSTGVADWDAGNAERAILQFQRAIAHAESGKDLFRTCWAQLRLVVSLAGRSGPHSALPLLTEARWNVVRLGDPHVSAALHIFVAEIEAKQGRTESALRHSRLGKRLLEISPHVWLEAVSENTLVAIELMRCDFHEALTHAARSVRLADQSGAIGIRRAALANLGNVSWLVGDFRQAAELFERAGILFPAAGEFSNGALDSLARAHLLEGRLEETERCLSLIDKGVPTPSDRVLYANRYAELTRACLFWRQERLDESLAAAQRALSLADHAGDQILRSSALIAIADIFFHQRRAGEAGKILEGLADFLPEQPPDIHAQYERSIACGLVRAGSITAGNRHYDRAKRIYQGLRSVPGQLELTRVWNETLESTRSIEPPSHTTVQTPSANNLFHNVTALMLHAGRPELIATGLVAILADAGGVVSATAVSRAADGGSEMLAAYTAQGQADDVEGVTERTFSIGTARGRVVDVIVTVRPDIESIATVNAVTLLLGTIRDLERGHAEREERLTLWPLEDAPADGEPAAIIMGRMSEVMSFARRVARTNVNVLITGESDPQSDSTDRGCQQDTEVPLALPLDRTALFPRLAWAA